MDQRAQYGVETKKLDDEKTMTNDEKTNDAAAASHRDELMPHA